MTGLIHAQNYVNQSMKDLHYNVFRGYPEENAFNVIKSQVYNAKIAKITALIIGESHCINIDIGSSSLTEVLACVIPSNKTFLRTATSDDIFEHETLLTLKDIHYAFEAHKVDLNRIDQKLLAFNAFYEHASKDALAFEHVFEMPTHFQYEAKTAIAVLQDDKKLSIQTLHLYPNEATGVVTLTTIVKA